MTRSPLPRFVASTRQFFSVVPLGTGERRQQMSALPALQARRGPALAVFARALVSSKALHEGKRQPRRRRRHVVSRAGHLISAAVAASEVRPARPPRPSKDRSGWAISGPYTGHFVSRFVSRFSLDLDSGRFMMLKPADFCGFRLAGKNGNRILVPAFAGSNPAAPARSRPISARAGRHGSSAGSRSSHSRRMASSRRNCSRNLILSRTK
jgi:hypothetical protein